MPQQSKGWFGLTGYFKVYPGHGNIFKDRIIGFTEDGLEID